MKTKILAALKTKFPGRNANVLDRIADTLAKSVTAEEQVSTSVEGVTADFVAMVESYGDSRATEAQQTAVQNYETKHNLKDGKPINGGEGNGGGTEPTNPTGGNNGGAETIPDWAKKLIEDNKSLKESLNKMYGERTTATRKQQLAGVFGKLPEDLRKPYERISVDSLSEDEFSTLLSDVTSEVDGIAAKLSAKGAVFGKPSAFNGGGESKGLTKEQETAIAAREGKVSDDGQPF